MYQTEIQFFWPLTEQIPLELDFEGCDTRNSYVYSGPSLTVNGGTGTTIAFHEPVWTSSLHIDSDTITFNNLKMPWYRKALFKLMGFKWKK